jgi:TRAP-type mannitol/chloroaromatic compound transport system permease small subunit
MVGRANHYVTPSGPYKLGCKAGQPPPAGNGWHEGEGEACLKRLLAFSRVIDRFNTRLGQVIAWAILLAVLVSAANAIIRKVLNTSSNAWLELQWILFGLVFLLCAPWTLLSNEHIRIDIVNSFFPKRLRDWIDVFGHLFFLVPVTLLIVYLGWPYFWLSYLQDEQSTNAGGLPVYPSKLLIPLGFTLLLVQGLSEFIKRLAIIKGDLQDTTTGGGHHAAAEAEAERVLQAAKEEAEQRGLPTTITR